MNRSLKFFIKISIHIKKQRMNQQIDLMNIMIELYKICVI